MHFLEYLTQQIDKTNYNKYFIKLLESNCNIEQLNPTLYTPYFNAFKQKYYYYFYKFNNKNINNNLTNIISNNIYLQYAALYNKFKQQQQQTKFLETNYKNVLIENNNLINTKTAAECKLKTLQKEIKILKIFYILSIVTSICIFFLIKK